MKKIYEKKQDNLTLMAAVGIGATYSDHFAGDSEAADHLEYIQREQREGEEELKRNQIVSSRASFLRGAPRLTCEISPRLFGSEASEVSLLTTERSSSTPTAARSHT